MIASDTESVEEVAGTADVEAQLAPAAIAER
jgi:hypothetical protein